MVILVLAVEQKLTVSSFAHANATAVANDSVTTDTYLHDIAQSLELQRLNNIRYRPRFAAEYHHRCCPIAPGFDDRDGD